MDWSEPAVVDAYLTGHFTKGSREHLPDPASR